MIDSLKYLSFYNWSRILFWNLATSEASIRKDAHAYVKGNIDGIQIPYLSHLKSYQCTMEYRMEWIRWDSGMGRTNTFIRKGKTHSLEEKEEGGIREDFMYDHIIAIAKKKQAKCLSIDE